MVYFSVIEQTKIKRVHKTVMMIYQYFILHVKFNYCYFDTLQSHNFTKSGHFETLQGHNFTKSGYFGTWQIESSDNWSSLWIPSKLRP